MTFFNRIVASLILTCVCAAANAQAVLPEAKPSYDAGRELNRTLRDLQKTRIERDLEKQIDESASEEKATVPSSSGDQQLPEVTVFLKKIEFSPSAVIPEAELRTIAAEYENRQAGMAQLYEMLDRVNLWYRTRGYVTAMAVLPPQKLGDGILKVTLIEGKVGRVLIEGNKTTRDEYVRNRIAVPAGKLLSIDSLNRDLVWFNGSNDVKLKVKLQAGEVRETTDYHIFVFEPADSSCIIFSDTAGNGNTGRARAGISYTDNSVSGRRDPFSLTALNSKTSMSVLWSYGFAVNHEGARVSVYNSCNNLTIAKDDTNGFNIKGQSSSVGVGLTVPEKITADCREELVFDLQRQVSQNKVLGMTFVDDTEKRFSVGKTFLKMWPGRAVYLKPVFTYCQYDGLGDEKAVRKFSLDAFWQKALKMGQQLNLRMSGQKAGNDYLPSADQLYLGGLYSVRGYDESIIGGDSGLNLKLDYSFPLPGINGSQLFTFYDWGRVYGKSLVSTRMIDSAGLGIKHSFTGDSQIVLTLGFPFVKKIGDEKIASHKVDLAVNFIF